MESLAIGRSNYEDINNKVAYIKNKPIATVEQSIYPIEHDKMDEDWLLNLKEKWWSTNFQGEIPYYLTPLLELRERLLSFGGEQVCLPTNEEDFRNIMNRGQLWYGDRLRLIKGEPNQCHMNSCALWELNKDLLTLVTGYALSKDGMWRQHSWLVHVKPRKNRIIETTTPRIAYYGFAMTKEESYDFCEYNLW